jgi:hypothetical protein
MSATEAVQQTDGSEPYLCTACRSPILRGAHLCPVCKTYQNKTKAALQFGSSVTAFTAATLSLIVWTLGQLPRTRAALFPREDVRVLACNNLEGGLAANYGDRDVFLSHVYISMAPERTWRGQMFYVNESAAPGKIVRIPKPDPAVSGKGFWVRGVPQDAWTKFLPEALKDEDCFEVLFFSAEDLVWKEMSAIKTPPLNTIPVTGYLEFHTAGSQGPTRVSFPAVASLRGRFSEQCHAKVPK